jgi:hypothetical protein
MPRPKSVEPFVKWTVLVPAVLAAEFELLFFDNVHGKPQYGKRSEIITHLLREYMAVRKGSAFQPQSQRGASGRGEPAAAPQSGSPFFPSSDE